MSEIDIDEYRLNKGAEGTYSVIFIKSDVSGTLDFEQENIGSYKDVTDMISKIKKIYQEAGEEKNNKISINAFNRDNPIKKYYVLQVDINIKSENFMALAVYRIYTRDIDELRNLERQVSLIK